MHTSPEVLGQLQPNTLGYRRLKFVKMKANAINFLSEGNSKIAENIYLKCSTPELLDQFESKLSPKHHWGNVIHLVQMKAHVLF